MAVAVSVLATTDYSHIKEVIDNLLAIVVKYSRLLISVYINKVADMKSLKLFCFLMTFRDFHHWPNPQWQLHPRSDQGIKTEDITTRDCLGELDHYLIKAIISAPPGHKKDHEDS